MGKLSYYCVRMYPDGSAKDTYRDEEGKDGWLEYNHSARGGNSLFVDGEFIPHPRHPNAYPPDLERYEIVSQIIKEEIALGLHDKPPEVVKDHIETMTNRKYNGYREEPYRKQFYMWERGPNKTVITKWLLQPSNGNKETVK